MKSSLLGADDLLTALDRLLFQISGQALPSLWKNWSFPKVNEGAADECFCPPTAAVENKMGDEKDFSHCHPAQGKSGAHSVGLVARKPASNGIGISVLVRRKGRHE